MVSRLIPILVALLVLSGPVAHGAGDRSAPEQLAHWQQVGPSYLPNANTLNPLTGRSSAVSGRVDALAVVPGTCHAGACGTIYLGAAGGGVWKTANAGRSWRPLTDTQASLSIGALAVDPRHPSIVYAGTGDPNRWCDGMGAGLLRSTNAGRTWSSMGVRQFGGRAVSAILIDPQTAGTTHATLYVATVDAVGENNRTGHCSAPAALPPLGVFVSHNGGQSWTRSTPAGADAGARSLVMDPQRPHTLYAGFTGTGIARSTDAGRTWRALKTGLPATGFLRISLAIAPSDGRVLYAAYEIHTHLAFYRSTDAGASWTQRAGTPDSCGGQCKANMPLAVDPSHPRRVYVGGTFNYDVYSNRGGCADRKHLPPGCHAALMKTGNGGGSWADISMNGRGAILHADDNAIAVAPGGIVYAGTDGGIFHSGNGGGSWTDLNRGLATFQLNSLSAGPTGDVYAGSQDNGTVRYSARAWAQIAPGDGGATATDPTNPDIAYFGDEGPDLTRDDVTGPQVSISPFSEENVTFYPPFALAPSRSQVLYVATTRIWRTETRGGTDGNGDGSSVNDSTDTTDWTPISFDLSCTQPPATPAGRCGFTLTSVAVSPTDPNLVVAGSPDSLWLTTDALDPVTTDTSCDPRSQPDHAARCNFVSGVTWRRIDPGLPARIVSGVAFGPDRLYAAVSGFAGNTPSQPGHVFASSDQGRTWSRIDAGLPDLPANDIVRDPQTGRLFVAMSSRVYSSVDGGAHWTRIAGLPNALVWQLQIDPRSHSLYAATHGRGIWRLPLQP